MNNKSTIALILTIVLVAVEVIFGAHFYAGKITASMEEYLADDDQEDLNKTVLLQQKLEKDGKTYYLRNGVRTYLISGTDHSDQSPINTKGKEEGYICKMADMIFVLIVDDDAKTYTILQIDRNTITDVQQLYSSGEIAAILQMQINTSYFYGHDEVSGCKNTVRAVSKLLKNTPIDHYASVGMSSIGEINHIAGGVTVTLEDDFTRYDPAMKAGATLHLTDEQAGYFTTRRMDIGDGSNAGRLRRQRTYLNGLIAAMKKNVEKDSNYINTAYDKAKSLITTDMTAGDIGSMGTVLLDYKDNGIITLDGETSEGVTPGDDEAHEMFTVDEDALLNTTIDLFYEKRTKQVYQSTHRRETEAVTES